MALQIASNKKNIGAENGNLAPLALARTFGEEEDIMEIESPAQSLKKLLEEKSKTKGVAHGKRDRDHPMWHEVTQSKNTCEETASVHQVKFKFWLGFEIMEKIAKEQGFEELKNQLLIESQEASPAKKSRSLNV